MAPSLDTAAALSLMSLALMTVAWSGSTSSVLVPWCFAVAAMVVYLLRSQHRRLPTLPTTTCYTPKFTLAQPLMEDAVTPPHPRHHARRARAPRPLPPRTATVAAAAAAAAEPFEPLPDADAAITKLLEETEKDQRNTATINSLCDATATAATAAARATAKDLLAAEACWQLAYASSEDALASLATPQSSKGWGTRTEAIFVSLLGGATEAKNIVVDDSSFWDDAKIIDEKALTDEERVAQLEADGTVPANGAKVALIGLSGVFQEYNGRQGVVIDNTLDDKGKIRVLLEEDLFFPEATVNSYPKNLVTSFVEDVADDFVQAGVNQLAGAAPSTARAARIATEGQIVLETAEILRRLGPLPNVCNTLSGVIEATDDTHINLKYVSMTGEFQQEVELSKQVVVTAQVVYANASAFVLFLPSNASEKRPTLIFRREREIQDKFKELGVNLDGKFPFLL